MTYYSDFFRRYRWTLLAVITGIGVYLTTRLFNVEVFEVLVAFLERFEDWELDEIFLFMGPIILGFTVDRLRQSQQRHKQNEIERSRLQTLRATITTVNDIVLNFLNNLALFRMEAEEKEALAPESLELLEHLIQTTSTKLRKIESLDHAPIQESMEGVLTLDYEPALKPEVTPQTPPFLQTIAG